MIVGLQTHFDGRIDLDTLRQVRAFGFRMARIDAQHSSIELLLEMVADAQACDLQPLVVVSSLEQIAALPAGTNVEWLNEVNIGLGRPAPMHPDEYNVGFREAADVAHQHGVTLWGPVIANLNVEGLKFLEALLPLPEHVCISVHRYPANDLLGNPAALAPHKRFASRDAEVEKLKSLIGDRRFGISETGFPTSHYMDYSVIADAAAAVIADRGILDTLGIQKRITEEMAADAIRTDLDFWRRHGAEFVIVYQLTDGPTLESIDQYGIRALGGRWKQTAYVAQQEIQMLEVHHTLRRKDAMKHPEYADRFTSPHPDNDGTVLCIEPGGIVAKRPAGTTGPWETWYDDGQKAVFEVEGRTYAILLVD